MLRVQELCKYPWLREGQREERSGREVCLEGILCSCEHQAEEVGCFVKEVNMLQMES
jgi:hypothetical protein